MPLFCTIASASSVARRRSCHGLALVAASAGFAGAALGAQTPADGALRGRLISPGSALPPGATVRLSRDDGPDSQQLQPTRDGSFTALALPAGVYTVRAELFGVPVPCAESHLSIEPGAVADLSLTLAPNTPKICPATSGAPSGLAISAPLLSSDETQLTELDSAAHDATLASAPATDSEADDSDKPAAERGLSDLGAGASGPSLNGLSPTQNSTLLDGLSTTQSFRSGARGGAAGGPRSSAIFGQSAVQSLRVLPRTFSAQYGGAAAGVVAVTSRGQAERLHGSAFLLDRQSAFAATNPFSVVTHYSNGTVSSALLKPNDTMLHLGASAGLPIPAARGPLRHASLFGSLEAQIRHAQVVSTPATASFYALTTEQRALLANRGVSAASANTALNFLDSLSGAQSRDATRTLGFARLDLAPSPAQQLTLAYMRNRFDSPRGSSSGASGVVVSRGRASLADSVVHVDAFTARWLIHLSPRATHELRGQLARDLEFDTPHAPLPQEPGISVGGFAPQVSIAPNGFSYGTPSSAGRFAYPDEHRLQLADSLTFVRGRHLFTLGADWSRIHDRIASATNSYGTFHYDSGTTGGRDGGLVDWITDYTFNVHAYPNGACPSINATVHLFCFRSYTQSFANAGTQFATHEIAAFAEDSLRLPHALLLTFGARYDYTLLPPPQAPNPALDAVLSAIASPVTGSTASIPEDRNNLGPRVSLAWAPQRGHGFAAHLGYGVFYGRVAGATVREALADTALPSTTRHIHITPSTITSCPQVANQGFGYPCAYVAEPPSAVAQTTSAVVFARSFRMPAVQRATFSLERAGRGFHLSAGYAMSIATQLPQTVDLNIAPAIATATFIVQGGDDRRGLYTGQSFTVPRYTARRSGAFGPITALTSGANATYHAFNAEARVHAADALQLRGGYTFSRAIDYGPQLSAAPRTSGQFDPFTDGYDKGLSSMDVPHRFTGDLVLRSALHHGPESLRHAVSGFSLASIASVSSGAPYTYAIFGGTRLSGGHESINGSGGATYLPTLGRNTLRLPLRSRVDLRASRDVRFREHLRLSAIAEAFNLLNSQSLSRVETRAFLVGAPTFSGAPTPLVFQDAATIAAEGSNTRPFGTPTSSTTGTSRERQLQLGLRMQF